MCVRACVVFVVAGEKKKELFTFLLSVPKVNSVCDSLV